ncbi:AAA domain-containing protein, partial [Helicobacter pylori]
NLIVLVGSCYSAELIRVIKREHQLEKTSSYNKEQVQKIIELLEQIDRALNQRKNRKTIGIITPYNAQKKTLAIRSGKMRLQEF